MTKNPPTENINIIYVFVFQADQEVVVEVEEQRKEEPVGDGVVLGQRKWYSNLA